MGVYMAHSDCATTACLAGHVVLAAGAPPVNRWFYRLQELPPHLRQLASQRRFTFYGWFPTPRKAVSIHRLALLLLAANDAAAERLEYLFGRTRLKRQALRAAVQTLLQDARRAER